MARPIELLHVVVDTGLESLLPAKQPCVAATASVSGFTLGFSPSGEGVSVGVSLGGPTVWLDDDGSGSPRATRSLCHRGSWDVLHRGGSDVTDPSRGHLDVAHADSVDPTPDIQAAAIAKAGPSCAATNSATRISRLSRLFLLGASTVTMPKMMPFAKMGTRMKV